MKHILAMVLLLSVQILPQNVFITGRIKDSQTGKTLVSANVLLYHLPDSTSKGTSTNDEGIFKIGNLKPGKYYLLVKYIGYKKFTMNLILKNKSIDLETISLLPDSIVIDEVTVVDKTPVVVQSGDTTVYNAGAFKVNNDAVAEDLLVKVPGIQMENGKVKAQGEEVKKVYVDGKTFFGDDPNAALKNIPANIIEKVQVFDQQSEQSQFTGFDDGNTNKAVNIITKLNIREGKFGKFLAGYGTDNRYNAGGNFNLFNEEERLSIVGQINNLNEQNFSSLDLLGVMGGDRMEGGGKPGGMGGRSPGEMRGPSGFGGNETGSLIASQGGETNTKSFGINYNNKWNDNLELGSSYFFNNTGNDISSLLNRDYSVSSYNGQRYEENSLSENRNTNHRLNLRLDYSIDSVNQIRFIPGFSFQKNNSKSITNSYTNSAAQQLNYSNSSIINDLKGIDISTLLLYRHRFNLKGRSVSLSLNTSYNKNDGTKKQISENIYYNSIIDSDTLNQSSWILNKGTNISAGLIYTEPINMNNFLMFSFSHSISIEKNDKETYNFSVLDNGYSLLNRSLSNTYQRNYITNGMAVGYHFKKNKLSFHANLNYNLAKLENEQEYPVSFLLNKKFYSLLPSLMFRYNISRDRNLNIIYRAFNNPPSVTQLQNVLDNSNPLQLSIGNPDLKQEYSHFAAVRFSTINFRNMNSLFLMFSGTYKNNYIGNKTIIASKDTLLSNGIFLNSGSQLSIPENVNGYANLQSFLTYGMPADFISSTFNINLSFDFTRSPGIVNSVSNYSNVFKYGTGIVIASNISNSIDFLISGAGYYNLVRNNISKENDEDYYSESTRLRLYLLLFDKLVLQPELNHTYDGGISSGYNPNTFMLNINIGMKLLFNNKGEFRFSVYDLLNQNKNITRQTTDYYTQEYSSNVIGRYFFLSFIYSLRTFN